MTPPGQGGGSVLLENVAAVEMALVVEVVVSPGVDGGGFLHGLYVSEFDQSVRNGSSASRMESV